MTRNNKHKPHRQSKHSSRDDRELSISDDGGKAKEKFKKDEVSMKASKDSSSDKRKHDSKGKDDRELSVHANGDTADLHNSKRRKERAEMSASDRWNGGGSERTDGRGVDKHTKAGNSRSVAVLDPNGKSGRRQDVGDDMEEAMVEKEKIKSSKSDTKHRTERTTGKDEHHSKDSKEKDNVVGSDKKAYDGKRALDEVNKRPGFSAVNAIEEQPTRYTGNTESSLPKDLRNLELERELEKRIRRRSGGSGERDKIQDDMKDISERRLSSRGDHVKDGRYKDEVSNDAAEKNKNREEADKDSRHHDERHRRHTGKEKRHTDGKYRDEGAWNDRYGDNYTTKNSKTEIDSVENHSKNSRKQSRRDASPIFDGKRSRHRDDREKKRLDDRDDQSEARSRGVNDHRHDSENRSSTNKYDRESDRGRVRPHHGDTDFPSLSRQKSSPTPSSNTTKDAPRPSNRLETSHRDCGSEERHWVNAGEASSVSAAIENAPTIHVKSSSAKVENKELSTVQGNKSGAFGTEETGDQGRTHSSGSSRFLHPPLPPSSRVVGAESCSVEANRDNKRYGDSGMPRCQGNTWRGVPNWPNTFFPFQNGMPPVGFPPAISPFSSSIFGVRPSMEVNHNRVPYHIPDPDRFPTHARHFGWMNRVEWEAKGAAVGDESGRYGRVEWDPNRNMMGAKGAGQNDSGDKGEWSHNLQKAKDNWTPQSSEQISEPENENRKPMEPEKNKLDVSETLSDKTDTISRKVGQKDDFSDFYFSKLKISPSLAEKDVYDKCCSKKQEMVKKKQESMMTVKAHAKTSHLVNANDIVFERAIALYKKQIEERKADVLYSVKNTESGEACAAEMDQLPTSTPQLEDAGGVQSFSSRIGAAVNDPGCDVNAEMPQGGPVITDVLGVSNDSEVLTLCRIPQSQNTH